MRATLIFRFIDYQTMSMLNLRMFLIISGVAGSILTHLNSGLHLRLYGPAPQVYHRSTLRKKRFSYATVDLSLVNGFADSTAFLLICTIFAETIFSIASATASGVNAEMK